VNEPVKPEVRTRQSLRWVPLVLIGFGLIVLGIAGWILLPKPGDLVGKGGNSSSPSAIPVPVNFVAPELELKDMQGKSVSLSAYRGQVILLNAWATWCPPCKAEMPVFQKYYEQYRDQGFTVIAVEAGEPVEEVADFARSNEYTFPIWPDPAQKLYNVFRNQALPSSWVIDRQGQVRLMWSGAISREKLEEFVTPILEE
jgi:cytochrome c biogenesis protein CcmG, thiol:disulfide interchange protein DsbE